MRALVTTLWGLFCACSWTWCIGMYLPVIMINRYGWPGFFAFAIPNVLGCAAFGYVIRSRARSEALVAKHGTAMMWFSIITIAYHMFFLAWLFNDLLPIAPETNWIPVSVAAIALAIGMVLSYLPNRDWLWLSVLVYAASLATLFSIGVDALQRIGWSGSSTPASLAWLTPTLCFGFLLCPYLDLTFHRALQQSPSRHAFAVFGIGFAVMLVLTCAMWFRAVQLLLPSMAIGHLVAQAVFTIGAHLREVRSSAVIKDRSVRWLAMTAPLLAAALPYLLPYFAIGAKSGAADGQSLYLRFLVFYGLVFPAYVLIVMFAARRASRLALGALVAVSLASLPLYELGFLHEQTWWLAAALTGIVLAALIVRRTRGDRERTTMADAKGV